MRDDVLIREVLAKCEVLKQVGFWPSEPIIRPKAWINNFDLEDRGAAAYLLDRFTFYNEQLTNELLVASYNSMVDGLRKGSSAMGSVEILKSLQQAVFTYVTGEKPAPTDSGYTFCRKARQKLEIPEELICHPEDAVKYASSGRTVVFLDDFIGSGDQFLRTWQRNYGQSDPKSFMTINKSVPFAAIYISLVTTSYGLGEISKIAPNVAVCTAHILNERSTVFSPDIPSSKQEEIEQLLEKYHTRLTPRESYIAGDKINLKYGYKKRGLMLGFQHSIPDSTLPIFWSQGTDWEPLIERI